MLMNSTLCWLLGHFCGVLGPIVRRIPVIQGVGKDGDWQRWKLCGKLGRSFPVGLGTSSRIRGNSLVFVLSRNFAETYALLGYFWVNLFDFQHFWVNFGHFWANFELWENFEFWEPPLRKKHKPKTLKIAWKSL